MNPNEAGSPITRRDFLTQSALLAAGAAVNPTLTQSSHGGNYATPHPEFYSKTTLKQTRAPEHGDLDIVATVLPEARNRGMKLFCSVEDVFRSDVPGVREVAEVDLQGRKAGTLCLFHPDVRGFWTAL